MLRFLLKQNVGLVLGEDVEREIAAFAIPAAVGFDVPDSDVNGAGVHGVPSSRGSFDSHVARVLVP
ncbi:hypothetical protein ABZ848_32535 [Streptomyces sp. NPDC047081]|uniref:hypothetical protein n=1 Tax=Streptomyces sp. NPDC047081 TaxID=3154706 RepID=UPI0033CB6F74